MSTGSLCQQFFYWINRSFTKIENFNSSEIHASLQKVIICLKKWGSIYSLNSVHNIQETFELRSQLNSRACITLRDLTADLHHELHHLQSVVSMFLLFLLVLYQLCSYFLGQIRDHKTQIIQDLAFTQETVKLRAGSRIEFKLCKFC